MSIKTNFWVKDIVNKLSNPANTILKINVIILMMSNRKKNDMVKIIYAILIIYLINSYEDNMTKKNVN